jgi:hypothetical protein
MINLSRLYVQARAVVLALISLPSILSAAWQEEKAKLPKNVDGTPKSLGQQYQALLAEADHSAKERSMTARIEALQAKRKRDDAYMSLAVFMAGAYVFCMSALAIQKLVGIPWLLVLVIASAPLAHWNKSQVVSSMRRWKWAGVFGLVGTVCLAIVGTWHALGVGLIVGVVAFIFAAGSYMKS